MGVLHLEMSSGRINWHVCYRRVQVLFLYQCVVVDLALCNLLRKCSVCLQLKRLVLFRTGESGSHCHNPYQLGERPFTAFRKEMVILRFAGLMLLREMCLSKYCGIIHGALWQCLLLTGRMPLRYAQEQLPVVSASEFSGPRCWTVLILGALGCLAVTVYIDFPGRLVFRFWSRCTAKT